MSQLAGGPLDPAAYAAKFEQWRAIVDRMHAARLRHWQEGVFI